MNKNGRIYRTLRAAKRAFFENPNDPKKTAKKTAAKKPSAENKNEYNVLIKEPAVTVMDLKSDRCTGCSACFNACPVDAISIIKDDIGFNCRSVDFDKCINCGKCVKVCPVIETKYKNNENPDCYAIMADDEIREKSSSGGMFSLAANYILDNGGYVCGAAFAENFTVRHIIISDKNDLQKLRGSKYVQSDIGGILKEVKELLDNGKSVLFSGCPCQVAGLYGYLGKDYGNLYTLDLVCHGTPPQSAFLKYLDEQYGTENVSAFSFRTKEYGYNCTSQIAYMKDGTRIGSNVAFDPYEKAMHTGLALKEMCTDCPFAVLPRQGDITIGDFWGISKFNAELNDGKGTSLSLINNDKGNELFEKIRGSAKRIEAVPVDVAKGNNRFGRKIRYPARGNRWFHKMVKNQTFAKSVDYALKRKFDVGIIGLWYGRNYGSMATYYALHQVLTNKYNLSVLMIENPLAPDNQKITKTCPQKISNEFYDVSMKYPLGELDKLNAHCDSFIVGSDQLWNVHLSRPYKQMYYLGFAGDNIKKIAYGTSFGIEYCGTEEERMISSYNLRRFDHVSVRDNMSLNTATNLFGVKNVVEVCDPTFLCPLEEYEKLVQKAEASEKEEYVLAYVLDPNERIGKELEKISEEQGCKVIVLLNEPPSLWERNNEALRLNNNANVEVKKEVTLYDWLWYYKNTKAVFTDSFHGTIFSLIYEKPFITLTNRRRGAERFISLLTPLGLTDRLYDDIEVLSEHTDTITELDYTDANVKLGEIKDRSMKWLENALFTPKKVNPHCVYATVDERLENK